MMKLATRFEGQWIYKAIEYRTSDRIKFENLVHAMAAELKVPYKNLVKMIYNIERRGE